MKKTVTRARTERKRTDGKRTFVGTVEAFPTHKGIERSIWDLHEDAYRIEKLLEAVIDRYEEAEDLGVEWQLVKDARQHASDLWDYLAAHPLISQPTEQHAQLIRELGKKMEDARWAKAIALDKKEREAKEREYAKLRAAGERMRAETAAKAVRS